MQTCADELPNELSAALRSALLARGIRSLTVVQLRALGPVLEGRDVSACAPTGSGKTFAYTLPLAQAHRGRGGEEGVSVLVLLPTRELAAQVHDAASGLASATAVRSLLAAGGAPLQPQEAALRAAPTSAPPWVVGTPGRLRDLAERRVLVLCSLRTRVLDEADRLLDEGLCEDTLALLRLCPATVQTLMLTATWTTEVGRAAGAHMRSAAAQPRLHIALSAPGGGAVGGAVRHLALLCPRAQVASVVAAACSAYAPGQGAALAFCATRDAAEALALALPGGLRRACLHGALRQEERDAALASLRAGRLDVLVCTDVAARGLDIPLVQLVVHAEPPGDGEAYAHRAGRAGRPGCASAGVSLLLYRPEEGRALGELERAAGCAFARIAALGEEGAGGGKGRSPEEQAQAVSTGHRLLLTDRMDMLTADLAELGAKGRPGAKGKAAHRHRRV